MRKNKIGEEFKDVKKILIKNKYVLYFSMVNIMAISCILFSVVFINQKAIDSAKLVLFGGVIFFFIMYFLCPYFEKKELKELEE